MLEHLVLEMFLGSNVNFFLLFLAIAMAVANSCKKLLGAFLLGSFGAF